MTSRALCCQQKSLSRNKEFWSKWIPRRVKHNAFVLSLWACVWLLGTRPLGRPLSEGWRFMLTVSFFARIGFSAAWMFITNFTHSLPWNEFLANDPGRTWPVLHNMIALAPCPSQRSLGIAHW